MKKLFTTVTLAVALFASLPSQAQVKLGLKGGYNVTNMSISTSVVDKSNQTGWFVGPTAKFTLPIVGLGIDAAVLYDQREAKLTNNNEASQTVSEKYVNIPINVRYSFGLGSTASIYLAAGPQLGFNVGSKDYKWNDVSNYTLRSSNFSVNVGAGVSLLNHLEIGATYNVACGKTGEVKSIKDAVTDAAGQLASDFVTKSNRTNAWQVYLAYYF